MEERPQSPTAPTLSIGGITPDVEEDLDLDVEDAMRPTEDKVPAPVKRRRRGRPRKKKEEPQVSFENDRITEVSNLTLQEASALDYDSWVNQFPWETGQYTLKVQRKAPTTITLAGKRVDIGGWLHEQQDPMSEGELSNTFGGKTLQVTIIGPDPRTGKARALNYKRVMTPGEPRLAPEALPHEMWETVKPLLIEEGRLTEEDAIEEELNLHENTRFGGRHFPSRAGESEFAHFMRPNTPQGGITKDAISSLSNSFKDAAQLSQRATKDAIETKERLFKNQQEIYDQSLQRQDELQSRLEAERSAAITERDRVLLQIEKERGEHRNAVDSLRTEMMQEIARVKEEAGTKSAEAMGTGLDFAKFMLPQQAENARAQIDGLTRTYEQRLSSQETAFTSRLEAERRYWETQMTSQDTRHQTDLATARAAIERLETDRRAFEQKVDALQTHIQNMLNARVADASSKNQLEGFQQQMGTMAALVETMKGIGGAGAPAEPDLTTPGGIFGKLMETVNNVAPSVAGAIAASRGAPMPETAQNPVGMEGMPPGMPMDPQMQQQQMMPQMQMDGQVAPQPNLPIPAEAKSVKKKVSISKSQVAEALDSLATIWDPENPPDDSVIETIARTVISTQPETLVDLLTKKDANKLIKAFAKQELIPPKLHTEEGHAFIKQILLALREARAKL